MSQDDQMDSLNATWFLPHIQARAKLTLCVVILLDLMATGLVAWQIIAHRDYAFDGDEAAHANGGLILALDLRAGDLMAFAVDSYQQDMYPPAFSWLEALVFLIFGASLITARMCSLTCLFLAALVLYAISLELHEQLGWLAGLVTVILTLTSQTILANAGLVMLEMPGLLVSLLTLWAYLRALKQPTRRRLVSVSLLAALTVLTKYPYGMIVVPTLVIVELFAILPHPKTFQSVRTLERWLWLFGPLTLIMLVWFAQPYKVAAFIRYATSQPAMVALFSLENLVY